MHLSHFVVASVDDELFNGCIGGSGSSHSKNVHPLSALVLGKVQKVFLGCLVFGPLVSSAGSSILG